MVTSREFAEAIADADSTFGRGRLLYMANDRDLPYATREYLQHLDTILVEQSASNTVYRHPADSIRPDISTEPQPLTPSEIAWLSGLPSDPEQVSFVDAQTLAQLARRTDRPQTQSDHRLVQQRWAPVQEAFDRREARHILSHNYRTIPDPTTALAKLVAKETTELTDSECGSRAIELAQGISAALTERRQRTLDAARRIIDEADERATARTTTEAPSPAGAH